MSNTYRFNVLTIDGAALIAQATAANPIVYVGALSKSAAAASAAELATAPASWYTGKSGEIVAVSATGNVAEIRAVWRNAGQSQLAKSVAVTARLASQSDAQAVVMTAMSDPDSTIVLPGSADTGAGVAIPFYVQIGAADSVEVTPGACASIADLARFVSIHSAGNPNTGDAQAVRGAKTFVDPVTLSATIAPNASGVDVGRYDARFGGVYASDGYDMENSTQSAWYGAAGVKWADKTGNQRFEIQTQIYNSNTATCSLLYNPHADGYPLSGTTFIEVDANTNEVTLPTANLAVGGTISTKSLLECRYDHGAYYTQALYGMDRIQYYDNRYQDTVDVRAECSVSPRWWVTFGDVDPVLEVTPSGVSVSGGFTPPTPKYDSGTGTSIPVGGLALIVVAASTGTVAMKCGESIVWDPSAVPGVTLSVGKAQTTLGLVAGDGLPAGTYKFLNEIEATSQVSAFALVIRVA